MIVDPNNKSHFIADPNKIFYRKNTNQECGSEIYLGYSYYIGGVLQDPPHKDTIEDFDEMYMPEEILDRRLLRGISSRPVVQKEKYSDEFLTAIQQA